MERLGILLQDFGPWISFKGWNGCFLLNLLKFWCFLLLISNRMQILLFVLGFGPIIYYSNVNYCKRKWNYLFVISKNVQKFFIFQIFFGQRNLDPDFKSVFNQDSIWILILNPDFEQILNDDSIWILISNQFWIRNKFWILILNSDCKSILNQDPIWIQF